MNANPEMRTLIVMVLTLLLTTSLSACTQSARENALDRWCDSSDRCDRVDRETGAPASNSDYCTGSPHCRAQRN